MNTAARLLEQSPVQESKRVNKEVAVADVNALVDMPLYGRKATISAVARLYRIYRTRQKALDTEMEVIKDTLRTIGQSLLDDNALNGKYYTRAELAGIPVTRANRFKPLKYDRDDLAEAVGKNEYRMMFDEDAYLQFSDGTHMDEFLTLCREAGVTVDAETVCKVSGTPRLAEHIVRCYKSMDPDSLELLRRCAVDQKARVGGK